MARLKNIVNKQGFTLIELSIVLVIIGLLVGGVLFGRDLIEAGKIRSQISQFEQYQTAYNGFKLKYGCVAGDCANATDFLGSATANGNGNGLVENGWSCSPYYDCKDAPNWTFDFEQARFFEQLSLSGLIAGKYTSASLNLSYPKTALNSLGGFSVAKKFYARGDIGNNECVPNNGYTQFNFSLYSYDCMGGGVFSVTLFTGIGALYRGNPNFNKGVFTPSQTLSIDTKIDDGKPFTGKLRAANAPASVNGNCPDTNTINAIYYTSNTDTACITALQLE